MSTFLLLLLLAALLPTITPVHLSGDLFPLIASFLSPVTLDQLPNHFVTQDSFRNSLEAWLVSLKTSTEDELVNVRAANHLASRFELTGETRQKSLTLSNPDNTQPAPWVAGLTLVLYKAVAQIRNKDDPIALFPWVFIPDGQAFHFFIAYTWTPPFYPSKRPKDIQYETTGEKCKLAREALEKLASRKILEKVMEKNSIMHMESNVNLAAIYVHHNRDHNPDVKRPTKSQCETLDIFEDHRKAINLWLSLWQYPWLKDYVQLGLKAIKQISKVFETIDTINNSNLEQGKTELKLWLKEQEKERNWQLENTVTSH